MNVFRSEKSSLTSDVYKATGIIQRFLLYLDLENNVICFGIIVQILSSIIILEI